MNIRINKFNKKSLLIPRVLSGRVGREILSVVFTTSLVPLVKVRVVLRVVMACKHRGFEFESAA